MSTFTLSKEMTSIFWPAKQRLFRGAVLALIASFLIALSAQITIPLLPIPVTLQTFTVMAVASVLGWRLGLSAVLLYLLEGASGFPVFAGWSFGLPPLMGPSAGYLVGFVPAVIVTGFLLEKGMARTKLTAFIAALLGDACILSLGVMFLATFIGIKQAVLVGFMPFIFVELVKLLALAFVIPKCWRFDLKRN